MSSSNAVIYTGFWTNRALGKIHGSTLTLSAENSAFLIAFVALFVKFVGGQLWSILTFLVSTRRSSHRPQDGLYHQQQVVLRNTSQPTVFVWNMLKLAWFWKNTATRSWAHTFGFIASSLAYIAAFAAAGIFSSKIASNNSEVLLVPVENCGIWKYPYYNLWDPSTSSWTDYNIQRISYWANTNELARQTHVYVSECFNSTGHHPINPCLPYGSNPLTWATTFNVTCPFDANMCIAEAIQFDSGFLSTRTHFGINTEDPIEYRRVMACAPITTEGYVTDYVNVAGLNVSSDAQQETFEGETWRKYTYGPNYYFNDNTTWAYSNFTWGASFGPNSGVDIYRLDSELSSPGYVGGTINIPSFEAVDVLTRDDADTTLVFLALNGSYLNPVLDPWFRSTVPSIQESEGPTFDVRNYSLYSPNALVNVVACTEQHQFRNPLTGFTTRLGGQELFSHAEQAQLGLNENQQLLYNRTFFIGQNTILTIIVSALDSALLLAGADKWADQETGLPDNQWQLEFNHYFGVGLHTLQLWSQQFVSGITRPELNKHITPASASFEKEICSHQITRREDYRSFSVLGLSIILVVGILVILLNLAIFPLVVWAEGKTTRGRYRNAEWRANEFLQLQRMAYEHKNIGTWKGHNDIVPTTKPGEKFTIPDSTRWNEDVDIPGRTGSNLSRLFSRKSRLQPADTPHSGVEDVPKSASKDDANNVQISETQIKECSPG